MVTPSTFKPNVAVPVAVLPLKLADLETVYQVSMSAFDLTIVLLQRGVTFVHQLPPTE